jgi:DNA-binding GntR family transcriptional regulator
MAALAAGLCVAQPSREVLNSERIAAKFGTYGVQVLSQDDRLRVTNLFSGDADHRICRTFALVRYAPRIDPALAAPHAAIVAGGSIGAVFAGQGWEVRKAHLHYGEIRASARLAELMDIDVGTPLAEHVYVLDVAKDGRVIEYAALVEIHHPDYLRLGDLEDIYGPPDPGDRRDLVAELLATATERSR